MSRLAVADTYLQARYSYGRFTRPVTGIGFHMTEGAGTMSDALYLSRNPSRGVSVHFVVINDGTIVQMLDTEVACGGLDPTQRATWDKGYYGRKYLVDVLGQNGANDPNACSIQVEIAGKQAAGPTGRQVDACIRLGQALRLDTPTIRGSFGHADQTDTKACPGTTAAMKAIFAGVGGHGLFGGDSVKSFGVFETPRLAVLKAGAWLYDNSDLQPSLTNVQLTGRTGDQLKLPHVGTLSSTVTIVAYEPLTPDTNMSSKAMFVRSDDVTAIEPVPPVVIDPNPDLQAQVTALTQKVAAIKELVLA